MLMVVLMRVEGVVISVLGCWGGCGGGGDAGVDVCNRGSGARIGVVVVVVAVVAVLGVLVDLVEYVEHTL